MIIVIYKTSSIKNNYLLEDYLSGKVHFHRRRLLKKRENSKLIVNRKFHQYSFTQGPITN